MKLNNKGVTLVELIVSFALVSIAVVYFYQTLSTVRNIYKTATVETQEFIDKSYDLKLKYAQFKASCPAAENTINYDSDSGLYYVCD